MSAPNGDKNAVILKQIPALVVMRVRVRVRANINKCLPYVEHTNVTYNECTAVERHILRQSLQ